MSRNQSYVVLFIACFFLLPAVTDAAQARGQGATAKPAADLGWLGAPDRQDPSPTIVSKKGVGTANAVAEARITPPAIASHCSENERFFPSRQACVKQFTDQFGAKIFRATADCTAGRITTTGDQTYTLDGLWDASDVGDGRTRWKGADGAVVGRDLINNGLHISQQWETLCPGPVSPALIARVAGRGTAAPRTAQAAGQSARPAPPAQSVCAGQPLCDEVNSFAVTITDFRPSQYDQSTKAVSATARFQNKTNRPLILGYVRNAAVAISEAGNRYTIVQPANVRGIGEIAGGQFDPKFTLQPGQETDARFEFWWSWNGRDIIGQRAWDIDLTVREVNEIAPGQYRFGQEHALTFKGVSPRNMTSASPAGGALASVPAGSAPTPAQPAGALPAAASHVAAGEPDACEGKPRCYDAGPFVAEILNTVATRENYSRPWHTVRMNIRFRNKTTEPIILGYVVGTGVLIDDLGNRYAPAGAPEDAKGIGKVQARSADPQFVLRPGETRAATFGQARVMRGTQTATVVGSTYTFDVSIAQLEVIYNGQQVRTVREYAMTFPTFGLATGAGAAAAPGTGATAPSAESIKKAGEAIRGLFGGGKK